jgi:hypothetical protein
LPLALCHWSDETMIATCLTSGASSLVNSTNLVSAEVSPAAA